ncbi:MAG: pyridoxal phosphate-dependent aminotransferase [Myxococcales bacterium]|nr:pyridoxal phosphate-dependent aminotransferase [Myxococcales bacterium]MCB9533933.1 pyridoxal phosphate-dependent aminotransferase [Myxococcales bacterium]
MAAPLEPAVRLHGLNVTLIRKMMAAAPPDALNLGLGVTAIDVPEPIRARVTSAATLKRAAYGPNAGDAELRQHIAARYGVDPRQIIVTCGVEEGIALAMLGLVNPGDEVVVPDPGFPVYGNMALVAGAHVVPYRLWPTSRFRPTWRAIEATLTRRTRLVVLASPGNPTGAVAEAEEWARIAAELEVRGIAVLSDEIYLDLQHGPAHHPSMWEHTKRGIVLSGLSKTHGLAGWRLGWAVVPPELAEPLVALHQHLVTSASTLVQEAAIAAFDDADAAAVPAKLRADLATNRALAIERLTAGGWEVAAGDGAFYLWVRFPGVDDDFAFAHFLLETARVITIPGRAFGDAGHGYLRLSYSLGQADLERALDLIIAAAPKFGGAS